MCHLFPGRAPSFSRRGPEGFRYKNKNKIKIHTNWRCSFRSDPPSAGTCPEKSTWPKPRPNTAPPPPHHEHVPNTRGRLALQQHLQHLPPHMETPTFYSRGLSTPLTLHKAVIFKVTTSQEWVQCSECLLGGHPWWPTASIVKPLFPHTAKLGSSAIHPLE